MKKFFIYFVTLLSLILVSLLLYSQAITVGLKLRDSHPYLEIAYYVVALILFYVLLLRPLLTVLFAPYYSVAKYCDDDSSNDGNIYGRAKKLISNHCVSQEEIDCLQNLIKNHESEKLSKRLYIIYNNEIKAAIDKIVVETARDAMYVTAISQSRFVDSLTILSCNFKMIKKIVVLCGFRPTFLRLCKLYINVFIATLAADGLSRLDVSALISGSIKGFGKILTNSATSGAINGLFVLRIGMLTKNYLYASDVKKEKYSIYNNSFTSALSLLPSVVSSLITSPIKGIAALFKTHNPDEDTEEEIEPPVVKWTHNRKK